MPPDADKLRQRHAGGIDTDRATVHEEDLAASVSTNAEQVKRLEELNGNEVCIDGSIYDISNFDHPGGNQLKIFGGNDVTVQYKMIHPYHTAKHLEKMKRIGKVSNYECEYEFDTPFERDIKKEVFKIVHRGKEFATPGYIFRCAMYVCIFFYLQYLWVTTGSSYQLAMIYGISQALIGLNVQHDANHGAISKKYPWINDVLGLGADFIGYTKWLWIEQHWTHHSYTNHETKDPDGRGAEPWLLFNDYPKDHPVRQWYHKYQAYLFLPAFSQYATSVWFNFTDLFKLNHSGAVDAGMKFDNDFVKRRVKFAVLLRILYFYINIIVPFQQHGLTTTALGHVVTMGVFGSLALAIPFSVSHNFENSDRDPIISYKQSNGKKKTDWFKAQVETSSTYGGAIAGYVTGGLNFQIEHHLFPRMSSSWYPYIAPKIREVCAKHNVRYAYYPTIFSNLLSTIKFIHKQGNV